MDIIFNPYDFIDDDEEKSLNRIKQHIEELNWVNTLHVFHIALNHDYVSICDYFLSVKKTLTKSFMRNILKHGNPEFIPLVDKYLHEYKDTMCNKSFLQFVVESNFHMVHHFLDPKYEWDMNHVSMKHMNILYTACESLCDVKTFKLLIDYGADISQNIPGNKFDILGFATMVDNVEIVEYLYKLGFNPTVCMNNPDRTRIPAISINTSPKSKKFFTIESLKEYLCDDVIGIILDY